MKSPHNQVPEPFISIIIPTYNLEHLVSETLDSVLGQEYSNYEVLVIDDRSTDRTRDVITTYVERDRRIKLLTNIFPQGAAGARNTGLVEARGEWVTFLDGDDTWINNTLKSQVDALSIYPDTKLITADFILLEPNGTKFRYSELDEDWKKHFQEANKTNRPYLFKNPAFYFLRDKPTTQTGVFLINRELLVHTGNFDVSLEIFEDQLLWIKLAHYAGSMVYIPKPLLLKKQRDGSLTRRGIPGSVWATVALKKLLNTAEFKPYKLSIVAQLSKFTAKNTYYYRKTKQKTKAIVSAFDGVRFSPSNSISWKNLIATLLLR